MSTPRVQGLDKSWPTWELDSKPDKVPPYNLHAAPPQHCPPSLPPSRTSNMFVTPVRQFMSVDLPVPAPAFVQTEHGQQRAHFLVTVRTSIYPADHASGTISWHLCRHQHGRTHTIPIMISATYVPPKTDTTLRPSSPNDRRKSKLSRDTSTTKSFSLRFPTISRRMTASAESSGSTKRIIFRDVQAGVDASALGVAATPAERRGDAICVKLLLSDNAVNCVVTLRVRRHVRLQ